MAIPCSGFTFTWNSLPLSDVQTLDIDLARGLPLGRSTNWTPNLGQVTISGFSIANIPNSDYGRRRRLTITSPAGTAGGSLTLLDTDCIYRDTKAAAVVNGVVQFGHVFEIQDTLGAASNP